ncbi:acyl-CoA thioesterase [bacterium]|nr:acyl-CoA thioesterase [bacterium]
MSKLDTVATVEGPWLSTTIRIAYGHVDQMGHVYYGNYLLFFEMARNEYMRQLGYTYKAFEKDGIFVPVSEAYVRYKGRIFYDDELEISARMDVVGKTRLRFVYEIRRVREDIILTEGKTIHALVDADIKPLIVPGELIELLTK